MSKKIDEIKEFAETEKSERLMDKVSKFDLPENLKKWINRYEERCGERSEFLWKWVQKLTVSRDPGFMFSTVPEKKTQGLGTLKTKFTIFIAVVDDIADNYKDEKFLKKALKIPWMGPDISKDTENSEMQKRINFAIDLWENISQDLKKLKRFEEFEEIFFYDLKQALNSCYHSLLINNSPDLLNKTEAKIYGSHNMIFYIYSDIDLMASPKFDISELSFLREVVWEAQQMARIGNWVSTWEREIKEGDFSSGVFASAASNEILSLDDLKRKNEDEIIDKIKKSNIEEKLLEEWQKHYENIEKISGKINSINISSYISGLEKIIKFHLASKGLK